MRLRRQTRQTTKRKLIVRDRVRKVMACHYVLFKFSSVVAVRLLV
jgi:hypothetical protein